MIYFQTIIDYTEQHLPMQDVKGCNEKFMSILLFIPG